ncbi:MAG: hypothetical protein JNL83_16560 [Myxococcales bacterium]|nr:hypothetical protein [Myxococcales bacterium]
MRIIVVEPEGDRRRLLVDGARALPGIVVIAAVPGYVEAVALVAKTKPDVIVLGEVPVGDLTALARLAQRYDTALVDATVLAGRGSSSSALRERLPAFA